MKKLFATVFKDRDPKTGKWIAVEGAQECDVHIREDGFYVGTVTEQTRTGNETINTLFIVSPFLFAALESKGWIADNDTSPEDFYAKLFAESDPVAAG